jgi:hypothetical protein
VQYALSRYCTLRSPRLGVYDGSTLRAVLRTAAIPGAVGLPDIIAASFAATRRGWRHPTFTCRRPAPWKESEMARGPGGLGQPAAMKRQQWWRSCCPSKDCRYDRESSSDGASKREAEEGPGTQERRGVDAERQPVCGGRKPSIGCGVGVRATRRTSQATRRRGLGRVGPDPQGPTPSPSFAYRLASRMNLLAYDDGVLPKRSAPSRPPPLRAAPSPPSQARAAP